MDPVLDPIYLIIFLKMLQNYTKKKKTKERVEWSKEDKRNLMYVDLYKEDRERRCYPVEVRRWYVRIWSQTSDHGPSETQETEGFLFQVFLL